MLKKLTFSLILLISGAFAQTSVAPLDNPKMQFLSSAGVPLAGGKVCTFASGTTTPLTTYSEATGSSANTNPITLDSGGFATIFVTSSAIKLIVYSSVGADSNCPNAGVSQYTVDGIAPAKPVAPMSLTAIADPAVALGNFWLSTTNVGRIKYSDSGAIRTIVATDTTDTLSNKTLVAPAVTGNMTYANTTPVANLATGPTTYNHSGTQLANAHIVIDSCTLGTDCAVTLTGAAVFTGAGTYFCAPLDATAANAVKVAKSSGSAFTLTGTGTDALGYICVGN